LPLSPRLLPARRSTDLTRTEVGDDGRLYGFHAERTVGPQQFEFEVERTDGTAVCVRRAAGEERSDDVAVDPASFVLHNNCTPHLDRKSTRLNSSHVKIS